MNLPWVSRAAYEQEMALREAAERTSAEWSRLCSDQQAAYDSLAQKYLVSLPAPLPEPSAVSPVARVIREQAQGPDGRIDYGLARHLSRFASQLKHEGKTPDEIVAALVQWQTTEAAD